MYRKTHVILSLLLGLLARPGPVAATTLSDSQLFFDPATITPDFYARQIIPTRTSGVYQFSYSGITDAKILPLLKDNNYTSGYSYTQSDYLYQPNLDYAADLTSGTLSLAFNQPGLYHVWLDDGATQTIQAIFASVGLLEDGAADKTGATKATSFSPTADLFLISDEPGDEALGDAKKILEGNGQTVDKIDAADPKKSIVDKAKAESERLGRKIHLEIVGHGREGSVRISPTDRINVDDAAKKLELENLQKELDKYVDHITFVSCSTGGGTAGAEFLKILGSSIGTAQAWDKPLIPVYDPENPTKGFFSVENGAMYKTFVVPLPASVWSGAALLLVLSMPQVRRTYRRAA